MQVHELGLHLPQLLFFFGLEVMILHVLVGNHFFEELEVLLVLHGESVESLDLVC
jgi:hypothetical protein